MASYRLLALTPCLSFCEARCPVRASAWSIIALSCFQAGCAGEGDRPHSETIRVSEVDTLVTAAANVVERPADMVIVSPDTMYLLDYGAPHILEALISPFQVVKTYGRGGEGPGELRIPLGLYVWVDTVATINVGNGRSEYFLRSGGLAPSTYAPALARISRTVLRPDGSILLPTQGYDESLVNLLDAEGNKIAAYGERHALPDPIYDGPRQRAVASQRQIPDQMKNDALLAVEGDTLVWVLHSTSGGVQKYLLSGRRLLDTLITDVAFADIFNEFVARNADTVNQAQAFPLRYFSDARSVAGKLWVLLNTPDDYPTTILVLGPDGSVVARIQVPGIAMAWRLAVSPLRREVFLSSAMYGNVYRIRLAEAEWPDDGGAP